MQDVEVLKNVEQNLLYLTDSLSEGTNRMSAAKLKSQGKMSPERRISGKRIEQSPNDKKFSDKINNHEGKGKN